MVGLESAIEKSSEKRGCNFTQIYPHPIRDLIVIGSWQSENRLEHLYCFPLGMI